MYTMSVNGTSAEESVRDGFDSYDQDDFFYETVIDGNGTSPGEAVETRAKLDPLEGLDREELAEIIAIDSHLNVAVRDGDQQNSELSHIRMDFQMFINELPSTNNSDVDLEVVTEETGNSRSGGGISTNSNTTALLKGNLERGAGDRNSVDGAGGPTSNTNPLPLMRNFRDMLGAGPVVDRFDDIGLRLKITHGNFSGVAKAEWQGLIYYQTESRETRGSQF